MNDNVVTGNAGYGIDTSSPSAIVVANRMTGNGTDIRVNGSNTTFNENMFDTGTAIRWRYNVKSDGTAIGP